MRHGALSVALCLAVSGCRGGAEGKPASTAPAVPAAPEPRSEAALAEVARVCAKHLDLLHRRRLAAELGPALGALAGPAPSLADLEASKKRLRACGIDAPGGEADRAGTFARLAQPVLAEARQAFVAWTPDYDDVGIARIRERRPGTVREVWGKAVSYEVLVLDGFEVPDYPSFREQALEHREAAREAPRPRTALLVIDAGALDRDRKVVLEGTAKEQADLRAVLEKLSPAELIREVELREAGYLRFQEEVTSPVRLDATVTWIEVQEGVPDVALATAGLCAGDRPEERRRQAAVQAIWGKLAAADRKEERSPVLSMPRDARAKKLKELSPYYVRAEIESR